MVREHVVKEQVGQELYQVVLPHFRDRDENSEERVARKQAVKEAKKMRRDNNAAAKVLV